MSRPAARITEDEVRRLVKAVKGLSLPISEVIFDGARLRVIIGDSGETGESAVDAPDNPIGRIREPVE